jgi:hypothetical protein
MSGDELTEHLVNAQRQRTYGNNTHNTIGCDGGPKSTCLCNGTKGRPRAGWCVSDGITHTWVLGKLEGEPNICDAEFMAKTVAAMICADKPNKPIVFDSKSSGKRYDRASDGTGQEHLKRQKDDNGEPQTGSTYNDKILRQPDR